MKSLITRFIWWKLQVHAIEPSDDSDWVWVYIDSQIRRPTQKKFNVSHTDIFLSEIVKKFITSVIFAAMISSANT